MRAHEPVPLLGGADRGEVWAGAVIDADVHANVPSLASLEPYLDPVWHQFARERNWPGPRGDFTLYPPGLPLSARPEWRPADGRRPASDVELLREQLLDAWNVEYAILTCSYGVEHLRHPEWSAALARAVNDWIAAEWLEPEPRIRAALTVTGRDVNAIVAEIERLGSHPGFVQVLMPVRSDRPYGDRMWFPVYDAMTRHGLVFGLHWGGASESPPTPSGWPSWFVEEYAGELGAYASQLVSLIGGGVFQRFPDLRVTVAESGFSWVPAWGWRMDKNWKGLRREVPWLTSAPTSLLREHVRFTTAPLHAGPVDELAQFVEWLGSDEMLMFATDYPHMYDDDLATLLAALPEPMRAKTMADTARAWYGL